MTNYQKKIYYVTQAQYDILQGGGTVGGYTGIDPDATYFVRPIPMNYELSWDYDDETLHLLTNGVDLGSPLTINQASYALEAAHASNADNADNANQLSWAALETTLTTTSDLNIPTSKAVATYVTGLGYVTSSGVTSVSGASPIVSSGGTTPEISLANNYGDTKNPYASKTAKTFLAAPNAADGIPTFRAILASDIPALAYRASSWTPTDSQITMTNNGVVGRVAGGAGASSRLDAAAIRTYINVADGATANTGTVTSVSAGTQVSGLSMTITNETTTPSIVTSISNATNFRNAISAAEAGHTHTTTLATDTGTSTITLAHASKYKLTAGGSSIIFTMPSQTAQIQTDWNATSGLAQILNKPTTFTPTAHNFIDTTNHPVSGLTPGHFLKATSATTYAFGAHGLTLDDIGDGTTRKLANYLPLTGGELTGNLTIAANKYLIANHISNSGSLDISAQNGVDIMAGQNDGDIRLLGLTEIKPDFPGALPLKVVGSNGLTANIAEFYNNTTLKLSINKDGQLVSPITGISPFLVTSTTKVANLNADKLDGADLVTSLGASSDTEIPSSKAIATYIANKNYLDSSSTLDDLGDVVITTPVTADLLRYNGTNWANAPASGTYAGPTETYLGGRTSSGYISVVDIDNFDEIIIELYTFYTYYWDEAEIDTTTDFFVTRTILPHNKFEHYHKQNRDEYNNIGATLTTVNMFSNDIISVQVWRRNASGTALNIAFRGTLSGSVGGTPWGAGVRIYGRNW